MTVLQSILLGLVQGLTEFLPVSSSGHLVLMQKILGVDGENLAFDLIVHLGTLAAVLIVYRRDVLGLVRRPFGRDARWLALATLPTIAVVALFRKGFTAAFSGEYLVFCFLITAILLLLGAIPRPQKPLQAPSWTDALIVGTVQGFAALPGISRSGSTISAALLLGHDRESAAKNSFLLSIPIIIGSAAVELMGTPLSAISPLCLLLGFATAFGSGLIALKLMIGLVKRARFDGFSVYLLILSAFLLINDLVLHLF